MRNKGRKIENKTTKTKRKSTKMPFKSRSVYLKEVTGTVANVKRVVKNVATEKNNVEVVTEWGKFGLPISAINSYESSLPKLPYEMFTKISGYLQWCAMENSAEGRVDLTIVNGEWVAVCFHQSAKGQLDVTVDFEEKENLELMTEELKQAFEKIHCTIHSHTFSSAFQSATDESDEMDKNGWHITLGKYGTGTVDNHARYTVRENAKRDENGVKISPALNFFFEVAIDDIVAKPEGFELTPNITGVKLAEKKENNERDHPVYNYVSEFPEEWSERFHKEKQKIFNYYKKENTQMGFHSIEKEEIERLEKEEQIDYLIYENHNQEEDETEVSNEEYERMTAEAFEQITKLDFQGLKSTIEDSIYSREEELAGLIVEWLMENAQEASMRHIPNLQTINLITFQSKKEEIALQIAEEVVINSL